MDLDDAFHTTRSSKEIAQPRSLRRQEEHENEAHESKSFGTTESIRQQVNEQDIEDIFSYARHSRCDDIERLLNRGVPVDVRDQFGNTLLIIACQNGNKKVAKTVSYYFRSWRLKFKSYLLS